VKLDFANALNAVSRSVVVSAVSTYLPQLECFTRCAYGTASTLLFGDFTISSACGVQHAGRSSWPSPFFRCNSEHFTYRTKRPQCLIFGRSNHRRAIRAGGCGNRIKLSASEIGLARNYTKCEAISLNSDFLDSVKLALPGCIHIYPSDCALLCAAIGPSAVSSSVSKRAENLLQTAPRMASIDHHDALALLRICLGHPKAIYKLRAGAGKQWQQSSSCYARGITRT